MVEIQQVRGTGGVDIHLKRKRDRAEGLWRSLSVLSGTLRLQFCGHFFCFCRQAFPQKHGLAVGKTKQVGEHTKPKAEGTYRFIFSNVSEGNSFRLGVFNSGWEKLESNSNLGNGGELKVSLLAGESYFIKVTQYSGSGNYILTTERQLE